MQCRDCKIDVILCDGLYVCKECGLVHSPQFVAYENNDNFIKKVQIPYYRQSYYREKLKLFTRIKKCNSITYRNLIEKLRGTEYENILELKKTMQEMKLGKYYKYIYSIYYDLTGEKLINLSSFDIKKLNGDFLKVEDLFKKIFQGKKNFPSYNCVIYLILKKNKYPCYKHIILPYNHKKVFSFLQNNIELLKL